MLPVPVDDFSRQCVLVGQSGSGKTGLTLGIMEEVALSRVPVLALDPKADLTNAQLVFPRMQGDDFLPLLPSGDPAEAAALAGRAGVVVADRRRDRRPRPRHGDRLPLPARAGLHRAGISRLNPPAAARLGNTHRRGAGDRAARDAARRAPDPPPRRRRTRPAVHRLATPPQPGPADELGDLAHALHTAADAVRAEMAAQTAQADALRAFVADTGHDVMIPLTVLQGHLAALRDAHPASDRVTSAMQEAHYLGGILRNLAAAARLETSHRTDPVDLTELVTRVAARHRPVAAAAGVELGHAVPDGPVLIAGDVTLLEQAVSNVVYNAVRHNRPGGHAAVTLDAHAGRFTLTVLDDGPGVSPDALARLGERGFRADETRSRGTTGEGIGLDITLRVARLHGIEVTFSAGDEAGLQVVMRGGVAAR